MTRNTLAELRAEIAELEIRAQHAWDAAEADDLSAGMRHKAERDARTYDERIADLVAEVDDLQQARDVAAEAIVRIRDVNDPNGFRYESRAKQIKAAIEHIEEEAYYIPHRSHKGALAVLRSMKTVEDILS